MMRHDMREGNQVRRPGVREGYDIWSDSYDATPNPLVALDRRYTLPLLKPAIGEVILDIGCGTGIHLEALRRAGSRPVGIDFSLGMLRRARLRSPDAVLAVADLRRPLPVRSGSFDAAVCALVSEHLPNVPGFCSEVRRVLKPRGRFVFSAFHPAMAEAGTEANFEAGGVEYRLGAETHTMEDYRRGVEGAGFVIRHFSEYTADEEIMHLIPKSRKYAGIPMLLLINAVADGASPQ